MSHAAAAGRAAPPGAYAVPIDARPPRSAALQTALFAVVFNAAILLTHGAQYLCMPLAVLPATRPYFHAAIAYTKLAFGRLVVAISQFFAPTRLVLTCEGAHAAAVVRTDKKGRFAGLELPRRSVWMSNHQVYTDWLYLWNVAYFADLADSITIILKRSLKWIPVIGWGMQLFRFYFISRENSDEASLGKFLQGLARAQNGKLLLLIFPEGTLVSKLTRPKSAAFAEKQGIEDMTNLLLPRSTGLWTCLRGLRDVEDLALVDFTMGYPGIPPAGYGQSYYTLTSIFMQGVPPPAVHMHMRITPARELPLDDRAKFDAWLLQTWRDKDALLNGFYEKGVFPVSDKGSVARAEVPIRLRSMRELGDVCCWAAPVWVGWALYRLLR